MIVIVNGQKIELFAGALVRDAVRKYSSADFKLIKGGKKRVVDRWGNGLDLDGGLTDGAEIRVVS